MTLLRIIKEVPHDEGIDPVNVELETRNKRTVGVAQGHKSRAPFQLGGPHSSGEVPEEERPDLACMPYAELPAKSEEEVRLEDAAVEKGRQDMIDWLRTWQSCRII